MRLTKLSVQKLPIPLVSSKGKTSQKRYYDDSLKGFGIRVTSGGSKAFFVEKIIHNKQKRMTMGHYPSLTVEMARKEAQKLLGKIATGIDPIAEKKEAKTKAITLKEAFEDYLNARNSLKSTTALDYQRVLTRVTQDWMNKPLLNITKEMVAKRHAKYGTSHSEARANYAMRVLRAVFNFAMGEYEDAKGRSLITENPVRRLSHSRSWYRVQRRQTVIKKHDLADWHQGLMRLENRFPEKAELFKDYFLLVLFTGLRRQEAASLAWNNIDWKSKTLTVIDPKNRQDHTLPLSDFLYNLLKKRYENCTNNFVFPADSKEGYLVEPRKAMLKVIDESGVKWDVHSLRRTFITIAESLDIPVYALKRLLNHKMKNDVTAGYVVMDVERLRKPMQMITDYLLSMLGIMKSTTVVSLQFNQQG